MAMNEAYAANSAARAAASVGDYATAKTALESDSQVVEYASKRTTETLLDEFSPASVDTLLSDLQSSTIPRASSLYSRLNNGVGVNFSVSKIQDILDDVAVEAGWSNAFRDGVKRLGIDTLPKAEIEDGTPLTLATVESGWLAYSVLELQTAVASGLTESVNPAIASGDKAAVAAALRDLATTVEA